MVEMYQVSQRTLSKKVNSVRETVDRMSANLSTNQL
jgi:hypothetical protein